MRVAAGPWEPSSPPSPSDHPSALPRFKQLLLTQADKFSLAEVRILAPRTSPPPHLHRALTLQGAGQALLTHHPRGRRARLCGGGPTSLEPRRVKAVESERRGVRQTGRAVCARPSDERVALQHLEEAPYMQGQGSTEKRRRHPIAKVGPPNHSPLQTPPPPPFP